MMKGFAAMAVIIAIVSGVIGFTITDSIVASSVNTVAVTNESVAYAGSVPQTVTLSNIPVVSGSVTAKQSNGTAIPTTTGINWTAISYTAGTINVTGYNNATYGNTMYWDYNYEPATYLSGSLSRTVATYIVPIGLLGILALAVLL